MKACLRCRLFCFILLISAAFTARPACAQSFQDIVSVTFAAPDSTLDLRAESAAVIADTLPAPMTLLDLRITRPAPDAPGVALYWTTSGELPGASFVVERRYEGEASFRHVAVVPSHNSPRWQSYSFVDDANASSQPSLYRLRRLGTTDVPALVSVAYRVAGAIPGPPEPVDENEVLPSIAAQ